MMKKLTALFLAVLMLLAATACGKQPATTSGLSSGESSAPSPDVNPEGNTDEEIASEGLAAMENWMKEIGVVMNVRELGVTEEMIGGLADATLIMNGGYKTLSREEIVDIFTASM